MKPPLKLGTPLDRRVWEALGNPGGWGNWEGELQDLVHFVVPLPNGIPQEALVAERVGGPGFVAFATQPAVAGQLSFVRLLNAGASGRKLLLDAVHLDSAVTVGFRTGVAIGGAGGVVTNKQIGGAASVGASMLLGTSAAVGGVAIALANPPVVSLPDPYQLDPGTDLAIVSSVVNNGLSATFYFRELPV